MTVGMLLCTINAAYAKKTLMEIGRSPFYRPPLTTVESLIAMVKKEERSVKIGFEKAGRPDLFVPFMAQISTARIEIVEFEKGDTFEWMLFKKKATGTVRVIRDVTWGNEKPFKGFKFDIESKGMKHTFVVPLGCGNIAHIGASKLPAPPPKPVVVAPPPNKPPQCGMTVSPKKAYCGEKVVVDATGSVDQDGEISTMSIAVVDSKGQVVSESVVEGGGLVSEVVMPCGENTIKVTLTDNDGETSSPDQCSTDVVGMDRIRFLADIGYYNMPDPGNFLFGRVGLEYKFTEQFGVLGMIGAAPHIDGIDGESALLIDVIGEYWFSRYFVDLGLGGWISDGDSDLDTEDSQIDLIAGVGARIYGEPEDFNASLFLEVRAGVDELDDFVDYGRFGFGVRFRF